MELLETVDQAAAETAAAVDHQDLQILVAAVELVDTLETLAEDLEDQVDYL
jgi:hypothetical protein